MSWSDPSHKLPEQRPVWIWHHYAGKELMVFWQRMPHNKHASYCLPGYHATPSWRLPPEWRPDWGGTLFERHVLSSRIRTDDLSAAPSGASTPVSSLQGDFFPLDHTPETALHNFWIVQEWATLWRERELLLSL